MTAPPRPTSRRRVLGRLAGTTAAAAAVTVLPAAAVERASSPPPPDGDDHRQRGYTESEHVRRYYRLARF
jgi:hypothetical protein